MNTNAARSSAQAGSFPVAACEPTATGRGENATTIVGGILNESRLIPAIHHGQRPAHRRAFAHKPAVTAGEREIET